MNRSRSPGSHFEVILEVTMIPPKWDPGIAVNFVIMPGSRDPVSVEVIAKFKVMSGNRIPGYDTKNSQ